MNSLRARLFLVWLLSLAAAVTLGVLLLQLYRQSNDAQVARAEAELSRACDRMAERYAYYIAGWAGPAPPLDDPELKRDLDTIARISLAPRQEGGILRLPTDEADALQALAVAALTQGVPLLDRRNEPGLTELTQACPLPGPVPDLASWVRIRIEAAPGYAELRRGLAVLLALMLGLTVSLAVLVRGWSVRVGRIIAALGGPGGAALPRLAPTGASELDRIVEALNQAGERLTAATAEAARQASRAVAAERMAALGRVAAGVAHEIRNPISAMRLRAESGLAGDDSRRRTALGAILGQIDRLDRLSAELLAMTQRAEPVWQAVELGPFLEGVARDHAGQGAPIHVSAPAGQARFDPAMLRRALDNLVQNALRATPADGSVTLSVSLSSGVLDLRVSDTGPGIDPAVAGRLFEPFVTTRPDGTGLGLAIAREMVQAHGGTLVLAPQAGAGAVFEIRIPQP